MTETIVDTETLAAFCDRVRTSPYLAVDTEFLRDKTYWPRLCLVQVASPEEAVAIDPLAPGIDLTPLWDLMHDPKILKVFHAARQDLEIFLHQTGRIPQPLFDTQVAAMVCGFGESVSFETLATKLAGAQIDKSSRFTDWSQRPLTERQIDYALSDVVYLRPIYEKLRRRLDKADRADWLTEEMAVLTEPATYRVEAEEAWRRLKVRSGKPRFLAVLKELAAWREREAQRRDVPRSRIMKDDALLDIAAQAPASAAEMARSRSLPQGFADGKLGAEVLAAVQRGLALKPDEVPKLEDRPELPPGVQPIIELLRVLLRMKCDESGVAAKLVANADDLERIAADDEADVPAMKGWRRQLFGEDALALKHGRIALAVGGRRVRMVRLDA
ncbi:MAG TPA: ribonuclease D [Alphaproteobacteria bacterium]|nr:ribonuclease D [Alphaproteobacteria bacterium]